MAEEKNDQGQNQNEHKKKRDVVLASLLILWFFSLAVSVILKLLDIMGWFLTILIPVFFLLVVIGYVSYKHMNKPVSQKKKEGRPELEDIISPDKATDYVRKYFQEKFGLMVDFNNDRSYVLMKTVGQEGYETKIYSMCVQAEGRSGVDYYNVVIRGHNPDGVLFLKNETNPDRIAQLEQGMATKSQQFVTETVTQRDDLSGREIVRKVRSPYGSKENKEEEKKEQNEGKENTQKNQ